MRDIKEEVIIFLKGLFMGAADIMPGVSGGTIALITGIYTRLIDAIDYVADLFNPSNWEGITDLESILEKFKGVDWKLFIPLLLGIGSAFILLARLINYLLVSFQAGTYSFFFGLILASAIFIFRKLEAVDAWTSLIALAGAIIGIEVAGLQPLAANHSMLVLFGSGAIAICAMILPGISGAFILLLLNQYEYVINLISTFNVQELFFVGLGAVTGLLVFSKVLHYLLHHHRDRTLGFLTGLMLGSLRLPLDVIIRQPELNWIAVIISGVAGFIAVFLMEKGFKPNP